MSTIEKNAMMLTKLEAGLIDINRQKALYSQLCEVQGEDWNKVGTIAFVDYDEVTVKELDRYRTAIDAPEILEIADTEWTPDTRIYAHFQIDLDEERGAFDHLMARTKSVGVEFTEYKDKDFFSIYDQAGHIIDDGIMTTPTNGGAGNPIDLTPATVADFVRDLEVYFSEANIPEDDRWIVVRPKHYAIIREYNTKTYGGLPTAVESGVKGAMFDINGISVYRSNHVIEDAGAYEGLAGHRKSVRMGEVIGGRMFSASMDNNVTRFATTHKATTMYGYHVPSRARQNLANLKLKV